ncbi:MAG TPA: NTP transferase domain-containing protein [Candidatus Sulfomarinibacteraceae bacterium]|nr:NTP transferase domain-containing protein [Candidatus Sulfomarinibacteraceae bacterium]
MNGPATAIVLAAGAGRRFGGGKLAAGLQGRPILQHVLDALAAAGIDDPVVVVGEDEKALDAVMDWGAARRVRNPDPGRGLSSSLRLGWEAAQARTPGPYATLVVLGDQPRLDPVVVRALLAQPADPGRPVVVARHADGARNPVRLEPEAAALVAIAAGDRGLGPLLDARPELVRTVDVATGNPDVDERADLVALLAEAWAARVRANAAQVETIREVPDGHDFYAPVRRTFVADPARADDPVLEDLLARARADETWLDIGSGAGRYALPLARRVRRVIAVDPSPGMLEALRAGMAAHGIGNVQVHEGTWPPDASLRAALGTFPVADVAMIAHVSYDIEAIVPFVEAMESAARRECVAVLMERNPASAAGPFWPPVHGLERVPLPGLGEFTELLAARGVNPEVMRLATARRRWTDRDELVSFLRRQLWTAPGSAADERLMAAVDRLATTDDDGRLVVSGLPPVAIGIVAWKPAESR